MRRHWPRATPAIELGRVGAAKLLHPVIGEADILDVAPVPGGLSNSNFEVALGGAPRRVLLRLYQNRLTPARKEAALARRLAGRAPIARFLHFSERGGKTDAPYAVLEWIDGAPLDEFASGLEETELHLIGEAVGGVLARIHAIHFPHHGFLDGDLNLGEPIDLGPEGLRAYLHAQLIEGPGGERLGPELARAAVACAGREGKLLCDWRADPCLVHGDFNPSNILLRRAGAARQVAAILDWEYALSGIPAMDFANLMRPPLGTSEAFADGLARGYRRAGGTLPQNWRPISRLADLFAWADILGRPETNASVIRDASDAIRAAIRG
jgi:aminoglycoside phosphotransferase (APT) family kinase protein